MPQTFVRKTFDQWLSRNCERFTCKPVLTRASKRGFDLKFENVTDAITCSIRGTGRNEIWVEIGPHSDLLTDFDLLERRDSNGRYYCGFCMNLESAEFSPHFEPASQGGMTQAVCVAVIV